MKVTREFKFMRETKGALLYGELNDQGAFAAIGDTGTLTGTVYVRKSELGEERPLRLRLTFESVGVDAT